jgi:hypothetical protein
VTGGVHDWVVSGFEPPQKLSATVAPVEETQVTVRVCDPADEHSPHELYVQE